MKALEFLKELKESRDFDGNIEYKLDEAISELEELQSYSLNNTCDSCKHFELDIFEDGRGTCRNKNAPFKNHMVDCDYCCNRFKVKA